MMLTILTGPTPDSPEAAALLAAAEAAALLAEISQAGWTWKLTGDDVTLDWARADIVVRVIRAVGAGRAIRFSGTQRVPPTDPEAMIAFVGSLEDDIVQSGQMVSVLTDDPDGDLVIEHGPEVL